MAVIHRALACTQSPVTCKVKELRVRVHGSRLQPLTPPKIADRFLAATVEMAMDSLVIVSQPVPRYENGFFHLFDTMPSFSKTRCTKDSIACGLFRYADFCYTGRNMIRPWKISQGFQNCHTPSRLILIDKWNYTFLHVSYHKSVDKPHILILCIWQN